MYFTPGMGVRDEVERPSDGFLYQQFSAGRSINSLLEAKVKFDFDTRSRRAKDDRAEESRVSCTLVHVFEA